MKDKSSIGALILAAGGSKRLGFPKQLLRLEGESLVRRVAKMALQAGCDPVVVVTGASHTWIEQELGGLEVQIIHNPDWADGQSTSLKTGMTELESSSAVLVLVADQVALAADWLEGFLEKFRNSDAQALQSSYENGASGVPLILANSLFQLTEQLEGDRGFKPILARMGIETTAHLFPQGHLDVDRPEDLKLLRTKGFNLDR